MWVVLLVGILLAMELSKTVRADPYLKNTKLEANESESISDCKAYYEQFIVLLDSLPDQLQSLLDIAKRNTENIDDNHDIPVINNIIQRIRNNKMIEQEPMRIELNDMISLVFKQFHPAIICHKEGQETLMSSLLKSYNETIIDANCDQLEKDEASNEKLLSSNLVRVKERPYAQKHYEKSKRFLLNNIVKKMQKEIDNYKNGRNYRHNASAFPILNYNSADARYNDRASESENYKLFLGSLNFLENIKAITNKRRACIVESNELFINILEQIIYSYVTEFQCDIQEERVRVEPLSIPNKSILTLRRPGVQELSEQELFANSIREQFHAAEDTQRTYEKEFKRNLTYIYDYLLDERINIEIRKSVYDSLKRSKYYPFLKDISDKFHEKKAERSTAHEKTMKLGRDSTVEHDRIIYFNRHQEKELSQENMEPFENTNPTNYIDMTYMISRPQIMIYRPKQFLTQRVTPQFYTEYMKLLEAKKSNDASEMLIKAVQNFDGVDVVLYETDVDTSPLRVVNPAFRRMGEDDKDNDKKDNNFKQSKNDDLLLKNLADRFTLSKSEEKLQDI